MENNKLMPHWTDIPKAKIAIWDLIKWYCKPEKVANDLQVSAVTVTLHRTVVLLLQTGLNLTEIFDKCFLFAVNMMCSI